MVSGTSKGGRAWSNAISTLLAARTQHLSLIFLFRKPHGSGPGQIWVQGDPALERKGLSGTCWGRMTQGPGFLAANTEPITFHSHFFPSWGQGLPKAGRRVLGVLWLGVGVRWDLSPTRSEPLKP